MTWNGLKVGATLVFGATLLSGCSSSGAEVPPSATLTVLDSTVEAQAAEADDISLSDLLAAPVPVACEHPAGQLVDGYLPGIDPHDGYVSIFGQDASGPEISGTAARSGFTYDQCFEK